MNWIDFDSPLFQLLKTLGIDLALFDYNSASSSEYLLLVVLIVFGLSFIMWLLKCLLYSLKDMFRGISDV